jgi:Flp pilus assembly protein TadG
MRRYTGSRKGNALVETALCFLLYMSMFLAIIEFGFGVFQYNFVSYAAKEGARYASTRGAMSGSPVSETEIQDLIRNQSVAMTRDKIAVKAVWDPDNTPGNTVTVAVSYPITPVLGWLLGSFTVGASSTMAITQ